MFCSTVSIYYLDAHRYTPAYQVYVLTGDSEARPSNGKPQTSLAQVKSFLGFATYRREQLAATCHLAAGIVSKLPEIANKKRGFYFAILLSLSDGFSRQLILEQGHAYPLAGRVKGALLLLDKVDESFFTDIFF